MTLLWWCYDLLVCLGAFCYLPVYAVRGKWHRGLLMRLGRWPAAITARLDGRPTLWIHAVSVGEALAARPFVEALRAAHPQYQLVFSTVTATGQHVASRFLSPNDLLLYWPLDLSAVLCGALDRVRPRALIVLESELWPNALRCCQERRIPVIVINGRISERSLRRYRRVPWLARWLMQHLRLALMQTEEDARRAQALGLEAAHVRVTGNLKFDGAAPKAAAGDLSTLRHQLGLADEAWLLIGGSTHPGEERLLLDLYGQLRQEWPGARLLLAPRHVERADEIETLARSAGHAVLRHSQCDGAAAPPAGTPIILLDTIGHLRDLYPLATIVVIGGSFVAHGGQNPLEASAAGKATVFGPHMFNFREVAEQLVAAQAAAQVPDGPALLATCRLWLRQPQQREAVGARARALVEQQRGATQRTLQAVAEAIPL